MIDHYQILGLTPNASAEQIKKAYRLLAQKYHPDSAKTADPKRFQEVREAYQHLKDPTPKTAGAAASSAPHPTAEASSLYKTRIDPQRQKEQAAFQRRRMLGALLRIALLALLAGLLLAGLGYAGKLPVVPGLLLGLFLGSALAAPRFFNLDDFLSSKDTAVYRRVRIGASILALAYGSWALGQLLS